MQRRVLWLLELDWREASEADVVAMVGWLRVAENPQRRRRRADSAVPGTVNLRTGKPHPGPGYAPRTINHALSVISGFYAYHRHHGRGPTTNPVPDSASRRAALAHRNPLAPPPTFRRGRLRQKVDQPLPRAIPDGMWDELFTAMTCDRDRALLLFYVSSRVRVGGIADLAATFDVRPVGASTSAPASAGEQEPRRADRLATPPTPRNVPPG